MTDAKAQARQRTVDYVARLLQMNPVHEGDDIVRTRAKALGLAKNGAASATPAAVDTKADRRKLLDALEAIRNEFWTSPLEVVQSKLAALNARDHADLQAAVERLKVVAAHRGEFPKLAQKRGFDGDFFSGLKEVLIRSPRDTAVLREQMLSSFRNSARRKSGRRMVQLINSEMPAIYQLEAGWFEALCRQKAQSVASRITLRRQPATVGARSGVGGYWWLILVGLSSVARLFTAHDSSSTTNHSYIPPNGYHSYNSPSPYTAPYTDLPPNVQEEAAKAFQRARERRNNNSFDSDDDFWRQYERPSAPESHQPPAPGPSIQTPPHFARPKVFQ